jgi:site-specific recombinase XerD
MSALVVPSVESIQERALRQAVSGLAHHSQRVYRRHLRLFTDYLVSSRNQLTRESVTGYLATLTADTPAFNQALSAIKRLANEAALCSWINYETAMQIGAIPSKKLRGARSGNWLSRDQAQRLLTSPDASTLAGKRDRAVLALLLGCGVRREELALVKLSQLTLRDGRPMLVDLMGKGNRVRTIGVPQWAHSIVLDWLKSANIEDGLLIRSLRPEGAALRINSSISASAIWGIVTHWTAQMGLRCAPHDLRRTYAQLARKSNAPIEVISRSLGHSSITTTEKYMNTGHEANAGDYFNL